MQSIPCFGLSNEKRTHKGYFGKRATRLLTNRPTFRFKSVGRFFVSVVFLFKSENKSEQSLEVKRNKRVKVGAGAVEALVRRYEKQH